MESTSSSTRILVIEDEVPVARQLVALLEQEGYVTRSVPSIRDARTEMPMFQPELLLLDTTLETDGLEFFQAMRFAADQPRAGIVILVDAADTRTSERALQLGAAAVITKPLRADAVTTAVRDLLAFT